MKKGKVFFHSIEGSAPLTISWSSGPKGDAIEARRGDGVGFFSNKGVLLCVIFDEVRFAKDRQALEFSHCSVEVTVENGKVTYRVQTENHGKRKPVKKVSKQIRRKKKRLVSKRTSH
jgi:hypothetical protein